MVRKICNILVALIVVCALALVAVLGIPIATGHQLYAVLTGSMEPTYPVGSIVVVKEINPEEVAVGDVITYEASGFSTLVTHRVQNVDVAQQLLYTKGDNNRQADFYPVSFSSVRGRVSYGIPMLGYVVSGIRTPGGVLVLLWVLLTIVVLLMLPDIVDKFKKMKQEQQEEDPQQPLPQRKAPDGRFRPAADKAGPQVVYRKREGGRYS